MIASVIAQGAGVFVKSWTWSEPEQGWSQGRRDWQGELVAEGTQVLATVPNIPEWESLSSSDPEGLHRPGCLEPLSFPLLAPRRLAVYPSVPGQGSTPWEHHPSVKSGEG